MSSTPPVENSPANPFASPREDRVVETSDGRTPRSRFWRRVVQTGYATNLAAMAAVLGAASLELIDSSLTLKVLFGSAFIAVATTEIDRRTSRVHDLRVRVFADAQSHVGRAIIHWHAGRQEATLQDIERAIELDPHYGPARELYVQATLSFNAQTRDPSVAESIKTQCDWLIEHQHEPAMAHTGRAAAHLILEDYDAATHDASVAVSLQPDLGYALSVRAYANTGREDYGACLKDTSVLVQRNESDEALDGLHAQALHQCGRSEESVAFAKSRLLRGKQQAEWACWIGAVYSEVGDYKNADAALRASVAENPELVDSWIHLTNLHFHRGDLSAAKVTLQRAIELDASEQLIVQCQAILAYQERRFEDAIRLDTQLLDISEDDLYRSVALTNRAYTWHAMKDYVRANEDYENALQCESLFGTRWRHAAWFFATCPDPVFRNGESAIELIRRESEVNEVVPSVCLAIDAAAHAEVGDFNKAIELQEMYEKRRREDQENRSVSNLDIQIPSNAMQLYHKRSPLHCELLLPKIDGVT